MTEHLGAHIKKFRITRGMTQAELAYMASVSSQFISNVERGVKANPRLDTLTRVADALGVSVSKLISNSLTIQEEASEDSGKQTEKDKEGPLRR